nr:diguanylate cyclase [Lachnospiraceae bacterium]
NELLFLIPSSATLIASSGCFYFAYVKKKRETAILFPTIFCIVFITIYVVNASGNGSFILWAILLPLGMCYFVSVKYGLILSSYYTVLIIVVFYSPLNERFIEYYNPEFIKRFPILYATLSVFTAMSMIQYHRTALFEIDHANLLTEEVERQTAVVKEQSRRIELMSFQMIHALANAIDAKDPYTKGHSTRVSEYSVKMAEALGWDKQRIDDLKFAALLHDIGKIGIPDSILNSPRKLTDVEFNIIRSHTTIGRDILKDRIMIRIAEDVAGDHHERYDGSGYPLGLKGEAISEEARIVAIADSFDAMSSDRIYRRACSKDHIRKELTEGRGHQFDPHFTDVFISLWEKGELDEILKTESVDDKEETEASSILLQEVVETFVTQGAKDDIDITTGILSRNAGEKDIAQLMHEESGCLTFIDLDNLKKINDTYGHDAGDRVLHMMGETLMKHSSDCMCCRLGGDEFLLFMKGVSKDEAIDRISKIIHDFEDEKKKDPKTVMVTISAGMVMCNTDDTYPDAYNKADKALYHVKQNGKSGYFFYDNSSENDMSESIEVDKLIETIKNSGSYDGAMNVEYREFAKLYEYVTNLEQRFSCSFKLIMISLDSSNGASVSIEELERSMYNMEQSIRQTIREVDVLTRYSRRQFLVILLGADDDGIRSAVDRIFRGYFKMNGSGSLIPAYSSISV